MYAIRDNILAATKNTIDYTIGLINQGQSLLIENFAAQPLNYFEIILLNYDTIL